MLLKNTIRYFDSIYKYSQHPSHPTGSSMTISRKYRSYGIRRLNNFSDIDNPEQALNNILNNLQTKTGESFVSEDLDAIRGIKDTEVIPSTFIQMSPSAPTYTFANTLGPQEDFVRPIVTLQDRVNIYRSVTGAAGKQGSGYGPSGWFVPSSSFKAAPIKGNTANTIIPNFSTDKSNLIVAEDFWTFGEFYINNSFHPSFSNGKGGIAWEAFYIPDYTTSQNYIDFYTTGLFHVEMDRFNTGDWKIYKSIYRPQRTVTISANNNTSATVDLVEGDDRYVAVGDKLTTNNEITILDVNTNQITLSSAVTAVKDQTISFVFDVGQELINDRFVIDSAYDIGERAKIRILWWYPASANEPEDRYLSVRRNEYLLPFSNFSNTATYTTGQYELSRLLDRGVTGYQPLFGDRGTYQTFQVNDVLRSTYVPPLSYANINKFGANTGTTGLLVQNQSILTANSTRMSQTSVGNIIITSTPSFSTISKNTRIKRVPSDNIFTDTRILTKPILATANVSIRAIDHNGLVDYFIGTSSGTTVIVDSTTNLKPGMQCITYFSTSQYNRIQSVINSTSFSTSTALGLTSNNYIFVYSDAGLVDSSKDVFCTGVIGKLLTAPVTAGSNTVTLESSTGLSLGMRAQYTGGIEPSGNYTITNIAGTQVRLSKAVTLTIDSGATIVFAPSGSTGDKQQCVIPLDLSPPFVGKDYGLDTNGRRITSVPGANLDVTVMMLSSNTATVTAANTTDVFSASIKINGTYRIKARKIT